MLLLKDFIIVLRFKVSVVEHKCDQLLLMNLDS
jgi:hypothetical protein